MQKRVRVDDNWVLARGQKVHGARWFRVEEYLGRGAFAAAYRVSDADGEEFFLRSTCRRSSRASAASGPPCIARSGGC